MTTQTLNFPVFHSEQGVQSDEVRFTAENPIADISKATDFELAQVAAKGDMVMGAIPMPAETSDTARLRRVSNHPVTQAIIGAKIAAVAPPTQRPNTS